MAINDAGQIAGLATIGGPNTTRAVVYDATTGTLTQLGGSIGGQTVLSSEGHDIDATGRVVGTAVLEPGVRRAFLYENGAMVELDTLIPPGSGWALQWATAINDVGQIVGTGTFRGQAGHYFLLTPANEPPTVSLGGPYAVDEGGALTVTASAGDPEEGDVTFDWDLDGHDSYEVLDGGGEVVLDPAGGDGPAERTIGVRVTDKAGLTAMASTVVQILNVAPSASLSTSAVRVYVNASVTLSFSNPSDPSAADVAAGFSYAWDCDDDDFFEASGGSSHDCAYPVAGGRTTKGRIGDKDGAFSDYAVVIDVRTPQAGIAGLIGLVQGFGLPRGIETSFVKKLEGALRSLEAGNPEPACGELLAFINHARAQSGKALTDEQAEQIIGEAEALRLALGCV
jgi:probable HAF family extracellular repeat protein